MIIPYHDLSPEALAGVLEEYVTRDGTELTDASSKITQARKALERGDLLLVYDPESLSCNLILPEDLPDENDGDDRDVAASDL